MKLTIGIIGIGAIGGTVTGYLSMVSELNIHALARSNYEDLAQTGLTLTTPDGSEIKAASHEHLHFHQDVQTLPPCDILILCVPSHENAGLLSQLTSACTAKTLIVTLQNGLGFEKAINACFPNNPLYSGTCWIKANKISSTLAQHAFGFDMILARFSPKALETPVDDGLHQVQTVFETTPLKIITTNSPQSAQLTKLALNVPFFTLMAREGLSVSEILASDALNTERDALQTEIIQAARRYGSPVDIDYLDNILASLKKMPLTNTADREKQKTNMLKTLPDNTEKLLAFMQSFKIALPTLNKLYQAIKTKNSDSER
ncbi:MAG: hypothetical protein COV52_03200 [Gammaproteobacteria bacterium CG11_big_fil_rev_8_21_14_0_20_46_22]|nr:MAG: hypothetical protein COW05_00900 [Gammaproteobacteria bacterium CG12_big_fil_rev_8_21_14_0_65_46_12]PIR11551.1 MAG: hypothetical protein COV52_03200 [Gammaproteobacteria bacterium CG11_big_fil_rev_8_21_14_0_20_46_22]